MVLGNVDPPSRLIQDQFEQVSDLFERAGTANPMRLIADQFYEAVKPEEAVNQQRLLILPLDSPVTWESLVQGEFAVLAVKVELPGVDGGPDRGQCPPDRFTRGDAPAEPTRAVYHSETFIERDKISVGGCAVEHGGNIAKPSVVEQRDISDQTRWVNVE